MKYRNLYKPICAALLFLCKAAFGQMAGVYSIPGSFASLATAISSLNSSGVSGPVTININAGYSEAVPSGGYTLNTITGASPVNQVIFQKNGIGANPLLMAYAGSYTASSSTQDGVWFFSGADYVTINGIDILDPNTSAPGTMELGYCFLKASATDGCQYNTIKNCTITLNKSNIGSTTFMYLPSGSRGIDAMFAASTNYTAGIVPTAASGCNSNNKFYNNLIQNCFMGIALTGYNHSTAPYTFSDRDNDVGGSSSVTSNTIINFTGFPIKTWGQHNINFSYNLVDNTAGGGSPSSTVRGVVINDAIDATSTVNSNTITVASTYSTTSTWAFIDCYAGGAVSPTNIININENVFVNCTMPATSSGGNQFGIRQNDNSWNLSISGNKFQNVISNTQGGDIDFIYNQSQSSGRIKLDSNDMSITIASTVTNSGDIVGVYSFYSGSTSTLSVSKNRFSNFVINNPSSTGAVSWIETNTSMGDLSIEENIWDNLSLNQTGPHNFIVNQLGYSSSLSISNNSITNGYAHTGTSGYMNLIFSSALASTSLSSTHRISGNNFSNITSTISGIGNFNGLTVAGATTTNKPQKLIYDNVISNITYNTTNTSYIIKMDFSSGVNSPSTSSVYNNTISNVSVGGELTGILIGGSNSTLTPTEIYGNHVTDLTTSSPSSTISGFYLWGNQANNFYRNKIGGICSNGSSGKAYGVYFYNPVNALAYNNTIGSILTPSASGVDMATGIYIAGGTDVRLFYNTLYLHGTSSGTLFSSNAVYTSTLPTLEMQNNILVNAAIPVGTGTNSVYKRSGNNFVTYSVTSNNNLFFAGIPNTKRVIFNSNPITYSTNPIYKNYAWLREYMSVTELPPFASTITTSSNYLQLNTTNLTQAESSANPLSFITNDFAGNTRSATNPDIGAWEGNYLGADSLSPVMLASGFTTPICNLSSRTFTANFVDLSGVASGSLSPRVYYKINTGPYTSTQGTLTSGNQYNGIWTFALTYTVNSNDVVSYYLVAQDAFSPPNIMAMPSLSFTATDVNNVITPPISPSSYLIGTVLSGTYTVGSSGNYTTLTAAANAYNTSCLAGPVTFLLLNSVYSAGETFPITFLNHLNANATNSLLITPNGAGSSTIQGTSSTGAVIKFIDAKYITINGTNAAGSSLSVINTNTGASACVWMASTFSVGPGCKNIAVENLTLIGANLTYTNNFGIYAGLEASTPLRVGGPDNDNLTVSSNTISMVNTGIYIQGTASLSAGGSDGLLIGDNVIGPAVSSNTAVMSEGSGIFVKNAMAPFIFRNNVRNIHTNDYVNDVCGIHTSYMNGATISQNTVQNMFAPNNSVLNASLFGIFLDNQVITSTVSSNNVHTIYNNKFYGYGTKGIKVATYNNNSYDVISNNMISDIFGKTDSWDFHWPTGLSFEDGCANFDVYNNTVHLSGVFSGLNYPGSGSAAFYVNNANSLNIKNNIFSNRMDNQIVNDDVAYAIFMGSGSSVLDYNDYYSGGNASIVALAGNGTNTFTTLSSLQSYYGGNANSVNLAPFFLSNIDPHISISASNISLDNIGLPIAGITTDIDQQIRNAATPDIGADEFTIPLCSGPDAGTIIATSFSSCVSQTFAISSSSINFAVNAAYQWKVSSTPSGPYSNVVGGFGATTPSYTTAVLPVGTYYYVLIATCGSSTIASNEVTVSVYPVPTSSTSISSTLTCSGQNINLFGSSNIAILYNWTGPNSFVSSVQNPTISNAQLNASGIYTLITSTGNCTSTASTISITVNTTPTVSVNSGTICNGKTFTMVPSGASTYTFLNAGPIVSPITDTSYTVTGTSTAGCVSNVQAISNITVLALPVVVANSTSTLLCSGSTLIVSGSGASSYTWSNGVSNNVAFAASTTLNYLVTGTSSLTGCTNTAAISISVNPVPNINVATSDPVLCIGQTSTLTANGSVSYTWNPGGISQSISISPTVTSNYTVSATGANGCTNTSVFSQSVSACTGLTNLINLEENFKIYPNPFNAKITIDLKPSTEAFIEIFNSFGILIYSKDIIGKTEVDLSIQVRGIYFIRAGNIVKKVVKD